jgi:hypothetical protein
LKRFILKVAIAILCLVAIIGGLNLLYMRTNYYRDLVNTEKVSLIPDKIKIASFGNSHCLDSIDWSVVHAANSVNFASSGQRLMYDYSIFQQHFDLFQKGSTIVIGVSTRSLYEPDYSATQRVGADEARYYRTLDRKYIYNYKWVDAFIIKYVPVLNASLLQKMYIFNDTKKGELKNEGANEGNNFLSDLPNKDIQEMAEVRSSSFISQIGLQQKGLQYSSICAMIDKAAEKQMNVVLVTFPTTRAFSSGFSDAFYAQFYSDIHDLCQRYNHTYYIDYTNDVQFADNYELFRDTDHLNIEGSAIFMTRFMHDLETLGINIEVS